ncbi:MAG: hypothetical protein ACRDRI_19580 [Pseudonocardiaceae bacterium]
MSVVQATSVGEDRSPIARLGLISVVVAVVLVVTAGGYGFHRDELYFLRAGSELAFGYVDQPPLTPLLAHTLDVVFRGSLVGLRVPSALMSGLVVLVTGLIAREFGAAGDAQLLAAGCMAVGSVLLLVGLVAGIGLENKLLPGVLLAALLVGVLVAGPRHALRLPWPWLAGLLVARDPVAPWARLWLPLRRLS